MQTPTLTKFTRYPKILIYALSGMGKSELASQMPSPVFIATTDGLEGLSVQAFPVAKTAQDVRDFLNWLLTEDHKFKTVVLDTLGWLEKLVHEEVCAILNLEIMTGNSMKSYPLATKKLKEILTSLDELNTQKKMMVCIIGHATIEKFEAPEVASFDRYQLQMNEKAAQIFLQDVDIIGFINQKVTVREEKDGFNVAKKATGSSRYIYFDRRPAFEAKQHGYGLPDELLYEKGKGWAAMWEIMKVKFVQPKKEEQLPTTGVFGGAEAVKKLQAEGKMKLDLSTAASAQRDRRTVRAEMEARDKEEASKEDDVPASYVMSADEVKNLSISGQLDAINNKQ